MGKMRTAACVCVAGIALCTLGGTEHAVAWSSEWVEVTAANGVKDDYYLLQREPEKCSF